MSTFQPALQPHHLSLPLSHSVDSSIHLHLTIQSHHILLFLTTTLSLPTGVDTSILSIPSINSGNTNSEDVLHPVRQSDASIPRGKVCVGSMVYAMPLVSYLLLETHSYTLD